MRPPSRRLRAKREALLVYPTTYAPGETYGEMVPSYGPPMRYAAIITDGSGSQQEGYDASAMVNPRSATAMIYWSSDPAILINQAIDWVDRHGTVTTGWASDKSTARGRGAYHVPLAFTGPDTDGSDGPVNPPDLPDDFSDLDPDVNPIGQ